MKFRVPKGAYFVNFGIENVFEGCNIIEIDGSLADEKFLVKLQNALMSSLNEDVKATISSSGREIIIRNIVRMGEVV